jgi:hypothetical protein
MTYKYTFEFIIEASRQEESDKKMPKVNDPLSVMRITRYYQ